MLTVALGCDLDESVSEQTCDLAPGALVIAEVMADPWGPEADGIEWVELYNASLDAVPLPGLVLERARADGRGISSLRIDDDVSIAPGGYVVLGEVDPDLRPDYVDSATGEAWADLVNTGGRVSIGCPGRLLDAIAYTGVGDGVAFGFDGAAVPDAKANDDPARWCPQRTGFSDGLGTPGAMNDRCPGPPPRTCEDASGSRPVRAPERGDLVIAEVLVDPSGADAEREWLELAVLRDVDLDGLRLGIDDETVQILSSTCVPARAGQSVVLGASADPSVNGDLPRVDAVLPLSLPNEGPRRLWLGYGDLVIDEVVYDGAPAGATWSLDPGFVEASANDRPEVFCPAATAWHGQDLGTPGRINPPCASAVPTGHCRDADGIRPIRPPVAGDVAFTEIMADPSAVSDPEGEWLELVATRPVDLNGLVLVRSHDGGSTSFEASTCLELEPGTPVVLARRSEPERNGGLPTPIATFEFALPSEGTIELQHGDRSIDRTAWTSAPAGAALARDRQGVWCPASSRYGTGDLGSPGAVNPMCTTADDRCRAADGEWRPIRAPVAGELVITEVMADPTAVSDASGEWLEVLATQPVDLVDLRLAIGGIEHVVVAPDGDCLSVAAGERVVVAKTADGADNGGLPSTPIVINLSLPNSGSVVELRRGGQVIDGFVYGSATAGRAIQVGAGFEATAGADEMLCLASTPYGQGDFGTPGEENHACR